MKYYIILNDVQLGPLDEQELRRLPLTPQTPAWHEGMTDWATCRDLPELADLFNMPPRSEAAPAGYDPYAASFAQGVPSNAPTQAPTQAPGYTYSDVPECPPTYLAWSIIATVLCCMPFGIVAIIKSCAVTTAYNRGDYAAASKYSKEAQTWIIVSAVLGLISGVLVGILQFTVALF